MKRIVVTVLLSLVALNAVAAEKSAYLVRLRDNLPSPAGDIAERIGRLHGVSVTHVYSHALNGFAFRGSAAAARALEHNPHVLYVHEDSAGEVTGTQYPVPSTGLDRIDQRGGTDSTYNYDVTGSGVTIYVVDTGVNAVSELSGRIVSNQSFVPHEPTTTYDCYAPGHGTQVASIAAGTTYGVAKGASIANYRAFDCNGNSYGSWILAALDQIATVATYTPGHRAVANLSFRLYDAQPLVDEAIAELAVKGVLVVASAGYGNSCAYTPAKMGSEYGVITVNAALGDSDAVEGYGGCIGIYAPSSVNATGPAGNTVVFGNSSSSAPFVSGVGALIMQRDGLTDSHQVKSRIIENSTAPALYGVPLNTPNRLVYSRPSVFIWVPPGGWVRYDADPYGIMPTSTTASASVQAVAGSSYVWTITNGALVSGQGTNAITFRAGCAGRVIVEVAMTTGSTTKSGFRSIAIDPLRATLSGSQTINSGESATLNVDLWGVAPWTLTWSDGFQQIVSGSAASRTLSPTTTTWYQVTARDAYNCSAPTSWAVVTVNP